MIDIFRIPDKSQPHIACVLVDSAAADDRLRRSELTCAIEFMMRGMVLDRLDQFFVNPVGTLFSLFIFPPSEHRLILIIFCLQGLCLLPLEPGRSNTSGAFRWQSSCYPDNAVPQFRGRERGGPQVIFKVDDERASRPYKVCC